MYVRGRGTRRNFPGVVCRDGKDSRSIPRASSYKNARFCCGDDPRAISHSGNISGYIVVWASSCSSPTSLAREQTHCGECIGRGWRTTCLRYFEDILSSFGKTENLIFNVISSRSVELTAAAVSRCRICASSESKKSRMGSSAICESFGREVDRRPVNNENQLASCSAPFRKRHSCTASSGKNLEPRSPKSRRGQDFLTRTLIDCSNIARIRSHWTKRRNNSAHVRYREKSL